MNKNLLTGVGKTLPPFRSISTANLISFRAKVTKLDAPIGAGIPVAIHEKSSGVRYLLTETDKDSYITFQELDKTKSYYIVALDKDDIFQSVLFDLNWSNTSSFVYEPKLKTVGKLHQTPLKGIYSYYQKEYLEDDDLVFSGSMATQTDDNIFTWNIYGTVNADVIDGYPSYLFTGGDNYIYLDSTPTLAHKAFTFECFFRYNAVTTTPQHLFTQIVSNSYRQSLFVTPGGRVSFKRDNVGDLVELTSLSIIPKSTWTHVALSYDGTLLYLFINGKLEATVEDTKGLKNITNNFGIGYQYVGCIAQPRWFTSCKYVIDFEPELKDFAKKIFKNTADELSHYVQLQTEIDQEYGFRDIAKNVPMTNSSIVSSYNSLFIANTFVRSAVKSSDFAFTGDGCVEALVKVKSFGNYPTIFSNQESYSEWTTSSWALTVNHQSSKSKWVLYRGNGQTPLTSSYPFIINELTHIALVREGSVLRLYYNGRLTDTFTNVTSMETKTSAYLSLGRDIYMDVFQFKFTKGSHRYSENFVPSFLENWDNRESAAAQHTLIALPFKATLTNFLNSLSSTSTNVALSTKASINGTRSAAFNNSLVMSNSNFYVPSERFTIEFRFKRETSIQQPVKTYLTLYQIRTITDHLLTLSYDATGAVYYKFEDDIEWILLEDTKIGDFSHFVIQRTSNNSLKVLIDGSLKAELEISKAVTYLKLYLGNTKDGSEGMVGYVNNYFIYKNYLKFEDKYEVPFEEKVEQPGIELEKEPEVIITPDTTSALNFENGLIDKVGTTIWQKEGTADITSTNKIFGDNSFETKVLGDSLYTNNDVITGGSTPFTVEFYMLYKSKYAYNNSNWDAPVFTRFNDSDVGNYLNTNTYNISYHSVQQGLNDSNIIFGKNKIKPNEITKFTMSYDGSCIRTFVNGTIDNILGSNIGFYKTVNSQFRFFSRVSSNNEKSVLCGIIDNINIHDGVATKVRDYDPYEEFLIVDLAFDGENNSTKTVDNGTLKSNWTLNGNTKISTDQKFNGFSSLYIPYSSNNRNVTSLNKIIFESGEDFTFSFEFIRLPSTVTFATIFTTGVSNVPSSDSVWSINSFSSYYKNAAFSMLIDKVSFINEKKFNKIEDGLVSKTTIQDHVKYKVDIVRKGITTFLYINNVLDSATDVFKNDLIDFSNLCIGTPMWSNGMEAGISCYIKNVKIYKGVAVIPEDPTGKIQLDFDNNVVDKYDNSTWINNGVTFDRVNSVKGSAAYFNYQNSKLTCNNKLLDLTNSKGRVTFDTKVINKNTNIGWDTLVTSGNADSPDRAAIAFSTINNTLRHRVSGSLYNDVFFNHVTDTYYNVNIIKDTNISLVAINDCLVSSINSNLLNFNSSNQCTIGGALYNTNEGFNGYIDNFKSYKEDLLSDETLYKTSSATVIIDNNAIKATHSGSGYGSYTLVLRDSPVLINFTAELEILISGATYGCLTFGTTVDYSLNDMDKFGYSVYVAKEYIRFGRGNNNATAKWVQLGSYTTEHNTRDSDYHRVKLVKTNSNFKIYLDDIFLFEVNDTVFSDVMSLFSINSFIAQDTSSYIKSVKIYDENDEEIYHKDWKSKIENPINNTAVHLPLETNANNIGFTNLIVSSVGNPTYHIIDGKKCIKFESGKYLTINSNNIFNLGTNSDFYIELNINIISFLTYNMIMTNNNSWVNSSQSIWITNTGKIVIQSFSGLYKETANSISLNTWYTIKLYRKGNIYSVSINDIIESFIINDSINLSINGLYIGCSGWETNNDRLDGYISNFKMFVGTSEIPETYNDKKVLDLDFKPTGKSYLFKDNNNKCVIHPVNITQRDYQDSQYCCTFNGTNQYLQLGKNDLFNFGLDDFVIYFKVRIDNITPSNKDDILLSNNISWATGYIGIGRYRQTNKLSIGVYGTPGYNSSNTFNLGINDIIITRNGSNLTINLNGIETVFDNFTASANFNGNNSTRIGMAWDAATETFFSGTIYSIKVLRNTSDLSLLKDKDKQPPVETVVPDYRGLWVNSLAVWNSSVQDSPSNHMNYDPFGSNTITQEVLFNNTRSFLANNFKKSNVGPVLAETSEEFLIDINPLNKVYRLAALAGTWNATYLKADFEFLDSNDNVIMVMRVESDSTFYHSIWCGATWTGLVKKATNVVYTELLITLDSNIGLVARTLNTNSSYAPDFSFTVSNFESIAKLKIKNLKAYMDYTGGSGHAAYVLLYMLKDLSLRAGMQPLVDVGYPVFTACDLGTQALRWTRGSLTATPDAKGFKGVLSNISITPVSMFYTQAFTIDFTVAGYGNIFKKWATNLRYSLNLSNTGILTYTFYTSNSGQKTFTFNLGAQVVNPTRLTLTRKEDGTLCLWVDGVLQTTSHSILSSYTYYVDVNEPMDIGDSTLELYSLKVFDSSIGYIENLN